ncbi:pyridoxal-dependent decarboxylase [Leptolyngbya sp. Heron Island J]|uniref:pyridoxal-dependent decarboxylase n=1 Tax=Leptolyngbya sp. Heron Island J TaxID=1385935 RepID=UPI0003B97B6E|nr:pyridoxal-dependent decarboxylase [Leptolyngbya sp. Heron Island J]ESA35629.1 pyridoxal-dependent decarboxylase [Leptolyngbya sp. Heron Island J]
MSVEQTEPQSFNLSEFDVSTDIKAYVHSLFSVSVHEEKAMEQSISEISQDFLSARYTSTNAGLTSLTSSFIDSQIPLKPLELDHYLKFLYGTVVNHSNHTSSPRFIGHMTSALPYFVRPLAKLIVAMNQNVVKTETAKTLTLHERQALGMMHRLVYGFSESFYQQHIQENGSTLGIVTSGGTSANISALWCARNSVLGATEEFAGVEKSGLAAALKFYDYDRAVIIGSSLMHYSFDKAADLLGIGAQGLIRIPADHQNRIELQTLRQTVAECRRRNICIIAIVGIAGTTDSGGIDSLKEIADIAQAANTHFHVDAAWGGPLLFSKQHAKKLVGIAQADSVTIDGHKQLYLPMGLGMVLLQNPHLANVIQKRATYTARDGSGDLGRRSLEGSRPASALCLHAGLNLIGVEGYEVLVDEGVRKTQYMANHILSHPEFELLAEPEMNILLYRYLPSRWRSLAALGKLTQADNNAINLFNQQLQKFQRQIGQTFISRTVTKTTAYGKGLAITALRAVIANPCTTESDIEDVLNDQIQIALELEQSLLKEQSAS